MTVRSKFRCFSKAMMGLKSPLCAMKLVVCYFLFKIERMFERFKMIRSDSCDHVNFEVNHDVLKMTLMMTGEKVLHTLEGKKMH